MNKSDIELGPLQAKAMRLMWRYGPMSIGDMRHFWPTPDVPAYVTLGTVVERLGHRGLVTHEKVGRAFVYKPVIDEEQHRHDLLRDFVRRYYGGDVRKFESEVKPLLKDKRPTAWL